MKIGVSLLLILGIVQAKSNWSWSERFQVAEVYFQEKDLDSAFYQYFQVVNYSDAPDSLRAQSLRKIGIIFFLKQDFTESEESFTDAINLFNSINDKANVQLCSSNLANVYSKTKQFIKAEKLYLNRLKYSQEIQNKRDELSTRINLSGLYINMLDLEGALPQLRKAELLAIELGDSLKLQMVMTNLTSVFLNMGKRDSALSHLYIAQASSDILLKKSALKNLAEFYRQEGNVDSTAKYLNQYYQYLNKLVGVDGSKLIAQLETQLQLERSKAESAQKGIWLIFSGSVFLLVLCLLVFDRWYSRRKLQEYKVLNDLFIQKLKVYENEKSEMGKMLHSDISPTLFASKNFFHLKDFKKGLKYLKQATDKLFEIQNNDYYSFRFDFQDWLTYVPTNIKHDYRWVNAIDHHKPEWYSLEFKVAVMSILEQILTDGKQPVDVIPRQDGVEIKSQNSISFSQESKALFRLMNCAHSSKNVFVPNPNKP